MFKLIIGVILFGSVLIIEKLPVGKFENREDTKVTSPLKPQL